MKRRVALVVSAFIITVFCIAGLCACNVRKGDSITLEKGSRPDFSSIIEKQDLDIIKAALSDASTEQQKKAAVMALYDIANYSRQNTALSLMLQSSDAGISMGDVIMHGFNLKSGDKWYYQLAAQASSDSILGPIIENIAGLLKIAYTSGDGNYHYTVIKGAEPECDCTVTTFPYATFKVTGKPQILDGEQFKKELHYLNSMHEINNMKFCAEIIADGAKITHNQKDGFYRVEFSVDMNADAELINEWFALPKEDMAVGGQTLKSYKYYNAVLEVWDNGYVKAFESEADRDAGLGSGAPIDKFEYIWNENEIMSLLKENEGIDREVHHMMSSIEDYIDYFSNPEFVNAQLSSLKIAGIVIGCILIALILSLIITRIVIENKLKQGKLPKLAAKREEKKRRRLERKSKRNTDNDDSKISECDIGVEEEENVTNNTSENALENNLHNNE